MTISSPPDQAAPSCRASTGLTCDLYSALRRCGALQALPSRAGWRILTHDDGALTVRATARSVTATLTTGERIEVPICSDSPVAPEPDLLTLLKTKDRVTEPSPRGAVERSARKFVRNDTARRRSSFEHVLQDELMAPTITTLDLFAGCGGLSLGFEKADLGFWPTFAVEIDPAAARTYKAHFGCPVHDGAIEDVETFPRADVIIGGPPCQGFSPLGRDRDDESRGQLNELWQQFLRAVREVRPKAFVIENVPEFQRSAQFGRLLQLLDSDPELSEYAYAYGVLHAADYGVPQSRRRGILMAVRGVESVPWPPPVTHGPGADVPYRTVRDAVGDLAEETEGFDVAFNRNGDQLLHFGRRPRPESLLRYKAIPEGGNRFDLAKNAPDLLPRCWAEKPTGTTDVMGRLWWDRPSVTIRTEFFKPEKGRYLHPVADRPISHREAARLQSFPDAFAFEGSKIEIARQIGNAVPVGLAEALARHLFSVAFEVLGT